MPDNVRPPRSPASKDQQPTLGIRALMSDVEAVAKARHLAQFRVAYKRNAYGDHVVAIIWSDAKASAAH
jgi:hypothetical protein